MKININNGRTMEIVECADSFDNCLEVNIYDKDGYFEDGCYIHEGDLVMLVNYFRNCKSGREISDYITPDIA